MNDLIRFMILFEKFPHSDVISQSQTLEKCFFDSLVLISTRRGSQLLLESRVRRSHVIQRVVLGTLTGFFVLSVHI